MEPRNSSSSNSWPWRRKMASMSSHNKLSAASISTRSSLHVDPASLSFHMYDDRSRAADWGTIPLPEPQDDNSIIDGTNYMQQLKLQNLTQRLNAALEDLLSKDMMVKQHAKVAEDAVAGWEKAQGEAVALRKELEICLQQKSAAERRAAQLEEALKEYSTELRVCHEREQKLTREWSDDKAALEARLMESEARSSAMAKSLQDRARAIAEGREDLARAEAEASAQHAKFQSLEMAMAGLRCEMRVQRQQMEMVSKEKDEWNKAAEAARKQNSESARKISKLEADCQRLRALVKKRLPRPADFARMKMEISGAADSLLLPAAFTNGGGGTDHVIHNNNKRMRLRPPLSADASHKVADGAPDPPVDGKSEPTKYDGAPAAAKDSDKLDSLNVNMSVIMNKLLALEEESKKLKEILSTAGRHPSAALQPLLVSSAAAAAGSTISSNILLNRFLLHSNSTYSTDNNRASDHIDHKSETIDAASCSELSSAVSANATSLNCKLNSAASDIQMQSFEFSVDPFHHRLNDSRKLDLLGGNVVGHLDQRPKIRYVPAAEEQESDPSAVQRDPVRALASKDIQNLLQSANLMCRDAITKLVRLHDGLTGAAEDEELGGGGRRPKSTATAPSSSVHENESLLLTEALDMVRKVDEILDDMAMAMVTSVIAGDLDETAAISTRGDRRQSPQIQAAADDIYLKSLQQQLQETREELGQAKADLADAKVIIGSLEVKVLGLRREQLIEKEAAPAVGGVAAAKESQLQQLRRELEGEVASLLKLRREQNEEAAAAAEMAAIEFERRCQIAELECANLQLLQECRREPQYSASCDEESSDMAAAKEKLVDCQRTILMLGRQLSALNDQYATPPPPSDDQSSLDSTGAGGRSVNANCQRDADTARGAGSLTGSYADDFNHPVVSNCSTIASMMDRSVVYGSDGAPRRSSYADGSAERGTIIKQVCTAVPHDSGTDYVSRKHDDEEVVKGTLPAKSAAPAKHRYNENNSSGCYSVHVNGGSAEYSSTTHLVDSSNCGLNILGSHRRMGSTSSEGVKYSVAEHLRMQDEYNVDSCCSSLYSSRSSPSVSPSRDPVVGVKRHPYHYANPVIRTSLKSSMDRAAAAATSQSNFNGAAPAPKSRGAHAASGFSRFFSRTRK